MRTRTPRVRRDPIDVQLIEAELAESIAEAEADGSLGADEILLALEAEVGRAAVARAAARVGPTAVTPPAPARPLDFAVAEPESAPQPPPRASVPRPTARREAVASTPTPAPAPTRAPASASVCGVASDQVRAWMDQVQDDIRQVRARVQFLRQEESRLVDQQRLVAELITSSNPV